ncbi:hypothetical protein [Calidifontibacillus erzurumensis]|uniref:Uncharacterized protein n=1 Tax=Calidifontibacillus erzurumensis TaxID=2741433 RepID=A0A8J8GIK0_9BACI|nr:hypothetical protein [Calidifontibacillus erzurumensis]NSL52396.1 hypothetical protein [Calidifontibacillus erzurumensis]
MSIKKQYYLIMTPLVIIGIYLTYKIPATMPYVILILLFVLYYFGWKDVRTKLEKAKGEEEIRRVLVPFILQTIFVVLGIISFFVNVFT